MMEDHIDIALGLLAAAFMAWAGIVYRIGNKTFHLMNQMRIELAGYVAEQRALRDQVNVHLAKDWHAKAGEQITAMQSRLDRLEREQ